jgi:hypothetical protein
MKADKNENKSGKISVLPKPPAHLWGIYVMEVFDGQ